MRVAFFGTRSYERPVFEAANPLHGHTLTFFDAGLDLSTAVLANITAYEKGDELLNAVSV